MRGDAVSGTLGDLAASNLGSTTITRRVGEFVRVAVCGAIVGSAVSQTLPAQAVSGIQAADSLVSAEFAKDSVGSITVGVVAGSRLVWTRSVGFADIKTRRLANRSTVYRIGSITKPFTAIMLMQLVAVGRVQLSDPVERYLPEVEQIAARPRAAAPFTFLQLATMTAGLAREPDDAGPFWTGAVAEWDKKLLAALPHTSYTLIPGEEYFYSNIGYAILGAALARAAGQPYTEWERLHVFRPLGMERTRFEIDPTIAADLALGYEVGRRWNARRPHGGVRGSRGARLQGAERGDLHDRRRPRSFRGVGARLRPGQRRSSINAR